MANFDAPMGRLYRKIPMTVQAIQWDGSASGAGDILDWVELLNVGPDRIRFLETNETPERKGPLIELNTNQGVVYANPTDWVVWGTKNDVYPCADEVFKDVFEPLGTV